MDIYLVTGNLDKVKELERVLQSKISHINIDLEEIQSMDTRKIARHKAIEAYKKVGKPVIIWDQSLEIGCLNGFPGPFIKWFWETVTLKKICRIAHLLKNIGITAKITLTLYDGKDMQFFYGENPGTIPVEPRGKGGFGWDPIFIPAGSSQTYSEMDPTDPNFHVFNRQAIEELKSYLRQKS